MFAGNMSHLKSYVFIKKKSSLLSVLSPKFKKRYCELTADSLNIYDVTSKKVRLCQTIAVDARCSVGNSEEKGCEECVVLTYVADGGMDSITFYIDSSCSDIDDVPPAVSTAASSAGATGSSSGYIPERETEYETARNSI